MQGKKQQLEWDMEQWYNSKLGKKCIKAVYCHPAYLTYMPSESESEVAQSCPTLCDPMDCSRPGSSVHGIFQARILKWVAIPFSRESSQPRDQTQVSHIAGRFFTSWVTRETQEYWSEMPGWMKHKLESRLLGKISITSDMQMISPLWQKVKKN